MQEGPIIKAHNVPISTRLRMSAQFFRPAVVRPDPGKNLAFLQISSRSFAAGLERRADAGGSGGGRAETGRRTDELPWRSGAILGPVVRESGHIISRANILLRGGCSLSVVSPERSHEPLRSECPSLSPGPAAVEQ